jgi:hypothetical protein
MLAKMSSTLDVISGGRFELGIGAGWAKIEHESYGIPFERPRLRVEKLEEAVTIVKKMWTENNPSFHGKHYRIDGAVCEPKPLRKPRPPIWKPAMMLAQDFYGSQHMLFGTDLPWGDTPRIIENIKGLSIPEQEKRMILGENAIKLLKIR